MSHSLRNRRRADRYAQLLEEASGGKRQRRHDPLDEELTELVALRHQLVADTQLPDINPEFRTGLRAMLVATADREGIGATAQPEPATPASASAVERRRGGLPIRAPRARTAVVAGVAIGAVAFTGMSTASENAMPGDPLYGVKRSTERAALALASSDVGRGALYLGFAETRLAEARLLGEDVEQVLEDMDRDAAHGVRLLTTAATSRHDPAALDVIDEFTSRQRAALGALGRQVDGADAARVATSLLLLDRIESRSEELRDYLDRCAGAPTASLDTLGPRVPDQCGTALMPEDIPAFTSELTERPSHPVAESPVQTGVISTEESPDAPVATAAPDEPAPPLLPRLGDELPLERDQPPAAQADPTVTEPDETATDGGLISDLNRLLGSLLGD